MKFYKVHYDKDIPQYGGKYVQEHDYGHEEFNFEPMQLEGSEPISCLGFVEPKSYQGVQNTFHIEKMEDCSALKNEPYVEDCVPLPKRKRNENIWHVPSAKYTRSYGFGQSMIWYPTGKEAKGYIEKLIRSINNYTGENHLYKYPYD